MRLLLGLALATALTVTGCGSSDARTLTVSAASSLTEAFTEAAQDFESENPDVDVSITFAGSSALAEQVNSGAPVDVVATASQQTMATMTDAGTAIDPVQFATNRLAIAVPRGNPAGIASVADLATVRTAVCAPQVPCGAATQELLARTGTTVDAVSLDPDVKTVLGRVAADEVDAGIVYATDVRAAGAAVEAIAIPDDVNVSTGYYLARVTDSDQAALADRFIEFVSTGPGQQVLDDLGFELP
jgi:molybdate transport system substrate-binding protein